MPEWLPSVLTFAGVILIVFGSVIGYVLTTRVTNRANAASTAARTAANKTTGDNNLIDQLQEELDRYRKATDDRLDKLERENTSYRRFVFALIDHSNKHGITPLPWPEDLPR